MKTCKCIIKETTFEQARKKIRESKDAKVIFVNKDDELSRKILEKEPIDTLVILQSHRKDKQKQRDSGLNQVLVKIAKKNKVKVGICLDEIIAADPNLKTKILARIMQNIELCAKNKVQMKFCGHNARNIYDKKALGLVLGMPTWMIKGLE